VFSLGTILAMLFRLIFRTFGVTLWIQVVANGVGLGLMIALAMALEHARHKAPTPIVARALTSAGKSVARAPTV
jgi:uncharacterized protein YqfA (UPF0365 family)